MANTMRVHVGALQDKTSQRGNLKLLTREQQKEQQEAINFCKFISSPIAAVARLHPNEVTSDKKPPKHISELFTTPHRRKVLELNGLIPNETEEIAYLRLNSISPQQIQELRARKKVSSLRITVGLPPGDITPLQALVLEDWEEINDMDNFYTNYAFPTTQDEAACAEDIERADERTSNSDAHPEEPVECFVDSGTVDAASADNTAFVEIPASAGAQTGGAGTTVVHDTNPQVAGASSGPVDQPSHPRITCEAEPSFSGHGPTPEKKLIVISLKSPINKDKALPPTPEFIDFTKLSPTEKVLPPRPVLGPHHSPPKRRSILDATDFEAKSPTFTSKFQILTPTKSTSGPNKETAEAETQSSSSSASSLKSDYSGKTHIAQVVTMQRAVPRLINITKPRATRTSLMRQNLNRSPSVDEKKSRDFKLTAPGPAKQRPASTSQLTSQNGSPAQRFNKSHSTAMTISNVPGKSELLGKKVRFLRQASSSSSTVADDDDSPSRGLTDFPSGSTIHEFIADEKGSEDNKDWSARYSNGYGMGMKKSTDAEEYIMGLKTSVSSSRFTLPIGHDVDRRDFAVTPTISAGNHTTTRRQAKVQVQLNTRHVDSRDKMNKRESFVTGSTATYVRAGLHKPSRIPRRSDGLDSAPREMPRAREVAKQSSGMSARPGNSHADMSPHPPRTSSLPNSPADMPRSSPAALPRPRVPKPPVYTPKQALTDRLSRPTNASVARQTSLRFSLLHREKKKSVPVRQSPVKNAGISKMKKAASSQTLRKAATLSSMSKLKMGLKSRARSLIGGRRRDSEESKLDTSEESTPDSGSSSSATFGNFTKSQGSSMGHGDMSVLGGPVKLTRGTKSDPVQPHDTEPADKMAKEKSERDRREDISARRAHVRTNAGRAVAARQPTASAFGNGGDEPPSPPSPGDGPRGHYAEAGEEINNDDVIESVEHDEDDNENATPTDRSDTMLPDESDDGERESSASTAADHAEEPSVAEMYDSMFRLSEESLNRVIAIAQRMEEGRERERATEAIEHLGRLIIDARHLRSLTIQWNRTAAETIADAADVASRTAEHFEALSR